MHYHSEYGPSVHPTTTRRRQNYKKTKKPQKYIQKRPCNPPSGPRSHRHLYFQIKAPRPDSSQRSPAIHLHQSLTVATVRLAMGATTAILLWITGMVWRFGEPLWPSGKALGWYVSRRASARFRFGSSFVFRKVVVCGLCRLVTFRGQQAVPVTSATRLACDVSNKAGM